MLKNILAIPSNFSVLVTLIAIAVIILINLSFIWLRKSDNQVLKDRVRYAIAITLIISEGSWHIWNIAIGEWTIQTHLPFHLCAVLVWTSLIMLLTKNYRIFEFAYFLGIAGASQAVLTPEAGIYGFPHYRVFQTLIAHGAIVSAAIFMTVVEGYRPHWSILQTSFSLDKYLRGYCNLHKSIDWKQYLYTLHKPDTASLMDFLGPWPLYLLSLELVAFIFCLLLYLPWIIKDRRTKMI